VSQIFTLHDLPLRRHARVVGLAAPDSAPEWERWLTEIGFLPGEPVMLLGAGRPGCDPLVVRIGDSTFALRRAEAACVQVALE
jgi:ferrous iron transport protein A